MGNARSPVENKIQHSIEEAQKALAIEDLGEAVKWILKLNYPVRTLNFLVGENLQIHEVPLYKEAARIDKRFGSGYCSELDAIGDEVKRLAGSYPKRGETGLVLVLDSESTTKTLKNRGFVAETVDYRRLLIDERVHMQEVTEEARLKLSRRDEYVERKVKEILSAKPTLVMSPLFERLYNVSEVQDNPLLQPEGVLIHRKLGEKALGREVAHFFLGLDDYKEDGKRWQAYGIQHVSIKPSDLLTTVKKTLNINYTPALLAKER